MDHLARPKMLDLVVEFRIAALLQQLFAIAALMMLERHIYLFYLAPRRLRLFDPTQGVDCGLAASRVRPPSRNSGIDAGKQIRARYAVADHAWSDSGRRRTRRAGSS